MGAMFSSPKPPKAPDPPAPPPPAPTAVDAGVLAARSKQKAAQQAAAGLSNSDFTKGLVDLTPANLVKKKVLGG